jgi:ABC-type spermidine/putrescine transport system permease subunit I
MLLKTKAFNGKKDKKYKKEQKLLVLLVFALLVFFAVHSFSLQTHSFSKSVPTSGLAGYFSVFTRQISARSSSLKP